MFKYLKNINKTNIGLFLLIFIFLLYFLTLAPDVTFEDSGELILSSYTLSIPHPPGYPLFTLISKLFSFLPFNNIAFKINFSSALFSSFGIFLLFLSFKKIIKFQNYNSNLKIPILATLSFATSTTVWLVSTTTEVYALNLFLFSCQLFILLNLIENFKINHFYLLVWLNGISLANHHSSIFFTIIIFLTSIISGWLKYLKLKNYLLSALLFFLAISLYLYLPIRSLSKPILNWGDPSNFNNLISVILRKQYGTFPSNFLKLNELLKEFKIINPLYEISPYFNDLISTSLSEFILLIALISLSLYGLKSLKNKKLKFLLSLIFIFWTFFVVIITQTPPDKLFTLKVFFIPAWSSFYFALSIGIFKLINKIKSKIIKSLPFIFLLLIIIFNFKLMNKNRYYFTYNYAENIFKTADYNSIIFTVKDNETFPLWKIQNIDYIRNDLIIINVVLLSEKWYIDQIISNYKNLKITLPYLIGNYNKNQIRSIFIENIIKSNPDKKIFFTTKNFENFVQLPYSFYPFIILYQINEPSDNQNKVLYFLKFENLENSFNYFSKLFDNLSIEKFKFKNFLDTQTKLVLQNCANIILESAKDNIYSFKLSSFLNIIIGLNLNNVYPFALSAESFLKQNNLKKAEYFYKKAIELQPNTKFAKLLASKLEFIKSQDIIYLLKTAENFYNSKEFEKAIIYYKKALEKQPSNPKIISNIADAYFNLKKYDIAIDYYKKAIKIDPYYILPYYNLGGCYIMLSQKENAIKIWKQGLSIEPNNQLLKNALNIYGK